MADEDKNTSAEIDDWLDDFEEADKTGAQIDQSDIEAALLESNGDDLTATPTQPEQAAGGDAIDQSEIYALLGGDDSGAETPAAAPEPEQAAGGDAIDQSEIDALLGGDDSGSTDAPAVAAADDSGPVSQDDIDALFGEPESGAAQATAPEAPAPATDGPVDQSEIDALFGDMDSDTTNASDSLEGGDDLDQLFNEFNDNNGKDKSSSPEEVDFTELLDEDKGDDESFTLGEDDFGLSADDFTLGTEETGTEEETVDAASLFGDNDATQALPDFLADGPVEDGTVSATTEEKPRVPLVIPAILKNKKVVGAAAMLSVALLVGGYLFMTHSKEPAIILSELSQEISPESPTETNTPPHAVSSEYKMPAGGGELSILLTAEDMEDDPLTFEITTAPAHGRISGEPPSITYLPNNNFPGEDRFTFLVSDGHGVSEPTDIVISGPNLAGEPAAVMVAAKPKPPEIAAKNITISMRSTESLDLDWRKIWKEANRMPFGKNVSVQIIDKKLHGRLSRVNPTRYRYQPDPYFSGRETIKYRFKMGKTYSKTKQVRLMMAMGTPPPEIRLAPLAESYQVGEQVTIDASSSRDENRATLHFNWEQTGGTPIRIKKMNEEGSVISFVVPSSFKSASSPGPELTVTAIDDSNQENSRQITINSVPKQRAALWRGTGNGSRVAVEPGCPQGRCPGEMLPWPYPD